MLQRLQKHLSFANVVSMMALFTALSGVAWAASLPKNSVGAAQIKKDAVSRSEVKKSAVAAEEIKDASLGGGELADNTVPGGKIQDGTVALADLAANSVNGSKVVDGSIGIDDLGDGSVGSGEIGDGAVGSSEIADGSIAGGDVAGGTFLGGKVTVQFEQAAAPLADGAVGTSYDVHCPAGQIALGGGFRGDATDSEYTVTHSSRPIISTGNTGAPVDNGTFTGWRATVTNPVGDLPQDAAAPGPGGPILPEIWVICAQLGP